MKKKLNVAVLMGGKSSEHEISLMTGRQIVHYLNRHKYSVFPVTISKDGKNWLIPSGKKLLESKTKAASRQKKIIPSSFAQEKNVDIAFIAMHGSDGEDGRIQGFLELLGIKYTGSGVLGSSICIDKSFSKKVLSRNGISVPIGFELTKNKKIDDISIKYPIFIKPSNQGSSVGSSIAMNTTEFKRSIKLAFKYSDKIMVEQYLKGTEITCAVLGNQNPKALPIVEIVSKNKFFDYESKYDPNLSSEICPARISKTLTKKVQDLAIKSYKALGCEVFGRVDMIIKDNKIYVLEINTIPGLTAVSLFPKAAGEAGISYPQLLDKIIDYSLQKYEH